MIRPLKEYTKQAFSELGKIQKGEKLLPKTGLDFIDRHLGCLLPSDVCLISAPSGTGKTHVSQLIKKNLLDTEINPDAKNYVICDYSLEMKVFNTIMRGASQLLDKKKSDVLFNEFTEEEKIVIKKYYESLNDDRQFLSQTPPTPDELYNECEEFFIEHKDKDAIFIVIDHVLLLSGGDKKALLDKLCENINQLKLKYGNVYFLLISQNNRGIYGRVSERNNMAAPNSTDVFGSSFMDQLCSFNVVLYDPYKAGINEYMKVNPERYSYLSEYHTDEDSKGKVSFITEGLIFAHCIKTRESDAPYEDIYVMEKGGKKFENQKDKQEPKSLFSTPVFENEAMPEPLFDMSVAFGEPEENNQEETPF